jgi:hypothetical protein
MKNSSIYKRTDRNEDVFIFFMKWHNRMLNITEANTRAWIADPMGILASCLLCRILQEPHGVTSQKRAFLIVTAVKTYLISAFTSLEVIVFRLRIIISSYLHSWLNHSNILSYESVHNFMRIQFNFIFKWKFFHVNFYYMNVPMIWQTNFYITSETPCRRCLSPEELTSKYISYYFIFSSGTNGSYIV